MSLTAAKAQELSSALAEVAALVSRWPKDLEFTIDKVGRRLEAAARSLQGVSTTEAERIEAEFGPELARLAADGKILADQQAHLSQVERFVHGWAKHHISTCPTCSSDLTSQGGLAAAFDLVKHRVDAELKGLREAYSNRSRARNEALARVGAVDALVRNQLEEVASLLSPVLARGFGDVTSVLADAAKRQRVIQLVGHLRGAPIPPAFPNDITAVADEIASQVLDALAEYDRVVQLPQAWKDVRQELVAALGSVTTEHLPKTLHALWSEVARNLTPAPWQYPGEVAFRIETSRTDTQAAVVVKAADGRDALARYVMNGAQIHTLGLAWFLVSYLLAGRFRCRFLVMDDPAHAMDQPTYRDFCRLVGSLLRLHKKHLIPLSLVLLFHQDTRAVDAARATGGRAASPPLEQRHSGTVDARAVERRINWSTAAVQRNFGPATDSRRPEGAPPIVAEGIGLLRTFQKGALVAETELASSLTIARMLELKTLRQHDSRRR